VTYLAGRPGVSPEGDRAADDAVRARYSLDDAPDLSSILARSTRTRTWPLLLAEYTYVAQGAGPDVPLVLAGHTPAAWGTRRFPDLLPAYIAELGLGDYVRWIGTGRGRGQGGLYRAGKVFAFPSRYEGFGLGPLEAMASGTPVVACNVSSIPRSDGRRQPSWSAATDAKAMGGAILACGPPDYARQIANRGLARAREFSWRKTAEGTFAVYTQALAR